MRKSGEKYLVDIYVQRVLLKNASGALEKDAQVSFSIERGKHVASSADKECKATASGDLVVEFNESLTVEATMYPEGHGNYQEKTGKLVVRQKKKGFVGSTFVPLGILNLRFHELIHDEDDRLEREVLLENCKFPGSKLLLVIVFRSADGSSEKDDSFGARTAKSNGSAVSFTATAHQSPPVDVSRNASKPPIEFPKTNSSAHSDTSHSTSFANFDNNTHLFNTKSDASPRSPDKGDIFNSAVDFGSSSGFDPFSESFAATGQHTDSDPHASWGSTDWATSGPSSPPRISEQPPTRTSTSRAASITVPPIPPPMIRKESTESTQLFVRPRVSSAPDQAPPPVPAGHNNAFDSAQSSESSHDIEFVKSVVVMQEEKLAQAAQYVQFQDSQISSLSENVLQLQNALSEERKLMEQKDAELAKLKSSSQNLAMSASTGSEAAVLQEKLKQAAEYVSYQDERIAELENQIATAMPSNGHVELPADHRIEEFTKQIEVLEAANAALQQQLHSAPLQAGPGEQDDKLAMAKEFIQYQDDQIASLTAELETLRSQVDTIKAHSRSTEAGSEHPVQNELEEKLERAAEYVRYQDEQLAIKDKDLETLNGQMSELRDELLSYKNQVEKYVNDTAAHSLESRAMQDKLTQSTAHAADSDANLKSKIAELTIAQSKIADLQSTLSALQASAHATDDSAIELTALKEKLQQAAEYIKYQDEQLETSSAELESMKNLVSQDHSALNEKLQQAADYIKYQDEQLQLKSQDLENHLTEIKRLSEALSAAELSVQQSAQNVHQEHDAEVSKISADLSHQTSLATGLQVRLSELEAQLAAAQLRCHDLEVERDNEKALLAETEAELKSRQTAPSSSGVDVEALLAKIAVHEQDLESAKAEIAMQQDKLSQAAEFIKYQDEVIAGSGTSGASEALAAEVEQLRSELLSKKDMEAKLEEKLQQAADYVQFQVQQLATKEKELAEISEKLASVTETSQSTAAVYEAHSAETLHLKDEVKRLSSAESVWVAEKAALEEKLQQAAEYIQYQDEQLASRAEILATETEEQEGQMQALRAEVLRLEKQLADNLSSLDSVQTKHTAELAAKEEVVLALKTEVEALKAAQLVRDEELKSIQSSESADRSSWTTEREILEQKLAQAAKFVQFQTDQIAVKDASIADLSAALDAGAAAKESESLALANANKDLQVQCSELQLSLEKAQAKELASTSEHQRIETEMNALLIEKQSLQSSVEALQRTVGELEEKSTEFEANSTKLLQLSADLKTREAELQSLNAKVSELETSKLAVEEALNSLRKEDSSDRSVWEAEKASMEEKLSQAAEYVQYQTEQIEMLNANVESVNELLHAAEAAKSEANEQLVVQSANEQAAHDTISSLKSELSAKEKVCSDLQTEMATLHKDNEDLKAQIVVLNLSETSRQDSAHAEKAALEESLREMTRLFDNSKEEKDAKDHMLSERDQSIAELTAKVEVLEQLLAAESEKSQSLLSQLEASKTEAEALRLREGSLESTKVDTDTQLAGIKQELIVKSQQLIDVTAQLSKATDGLQEMEQLVSSLRAAAAMTDTHSEEKAALEEKLQQAAEYVQFQEQQLAAKDAEIAELNLKMATVAESVQPSGSVSEKHAIEEVAKLREAEAVWAAEKAGLEEKLQQAAEYIQYQDEQIAAKDEELAVNSHAELEEESELQFLKSSVVELESQLASAKALSSRLQDELAAAGKANEAIARKSESDELAVALRASAEKDVKLAASEYETLALQKKLDIACADLEKAQVNLSQANERLAAVEALAEKASETTDLNNKLQQAADYIAHQDSELSDLRVKVNTLNSSLTAKDKQLIELQKSVDSSNGSELQTKLVAMENEMKKQSAGFEVRMRGKEAEFDKLVDDLIDAKVQLANALNDIDNEKMKAHDYKRQLKEFKDFSQHTATSFH